MKFFRKEYQGGKDHDIRKHSNRKKKSRNDMEDYDCYIGPWASELIPEEKGNTKVIKASEPAKEEMYPGIIKKKTDQR
jgi:hypothetical protein